MKKILFLLVIVLSFSVSGFPVAAQDVASSSASNRQVTPSLQNSDAASDQHPESTSGDPLPGGADATAPITDVTPPTQSHQLSPSSETDRQQLSVVSQRVEALLTSGTTQDGIAEQIRLIAQAQHAAQTEIEAALTQVEARPGWLKRLLGPDREALVTLEQVIAESNERLEQLQILQSQISNSIDAIPVQEVINAMTEQNQLLTGRVASEREITGLFGWLISLFS